MPSPGLNSREGEELVKKRLDRVVCNIEWRVEFPEAKVFALPVIGSDHYPLLLTLSSTPVRKKKSFRFEAFWLEHEECGKVIKEAWNAINLTKDDLARRIRAVTTSLDKWSRKAFANSQKQISSLQSELQDLMNDPNLNADEKEKKRIIKEIENMWRREEMY